MALNLGTLFLRVNVHGDSSVRRMGESLGILENTAKHAAAGLALIAPALALGKLKDATDTYIEFSNSIKIATSASGDYETAMRAIGNISRKTGTELETTGLLYRRLQMATERLGLSQDRLIGIVDTVNKAVALGGSSAQEAAGALRQFSQAIANDFTAAGQEINSVLEQTPGLAKAIADGMGITTAELKQMANDQELSAQQVLESLERMAAGVDSQYEQVAFSIDKSLTKIGIGFTELVGRLDEATGFSKDFADAAQEIADALASDKMVNALTFTTQNLGAIAGLVPGLREALAISNMIGESPKEGPLASPGASEELDMPIKESDVETQNKRMEEILTRFRKFREEVGQVDPVHKLPPNQETGAPPPSLGSQEEKDASMARATEVLEAEIERQKTLIQIQSELTMSMYDLGESSSLTSEELAQMEQEVAKLEEKMKGASPELKAFAKGMEDALGTEFKNILLGNFDDIGDAFKNMIAEMTAKWLAAKAMGILSGGSGGGGMFGGFFADGGNPPLNRPSIVGERGPELFVPRSSGTIIPNEAMGGKTFNINMNFSGSQGGEDMRRSAKQAARELKRQLAGV